MNLDTLNKLMIQKQEVLISEQEEKIKSLEERERLADGIIFNLNKIIEELQKRLDFYEKP